MCEETKLPYIEMMKPDNLKLRPIVAGPANKTHRLSSFLDLLLKTFLKHIPSYIRDDIDFLQHLPQSVEEDTVLVTLDVVGLYSNIPHDFGIKALEYWIDKHPEELPDRVPILAGIILGVLLIVAMILCYKKCHRRNRYGYIHLERDMTLSERILEEQRQRQHSFRESAWISCQFYLRSNPQYSSLKHLPELGSRSGKQFFSVADNHSNSPRLLTIISPDQSMVPPFNMATNKSLRELFAGLKHPYVFPTTEIDFLIDRNLIVVVNPISQSGSLKDFIYQSKWMDGWQKKYGCKGRPLPLQTIQVYGKQILMAMLYLEEKGFPLHGHIHSGNVMLQNNICRLSGNENVFLGFIPKVHSLIKKKLKENKESLDSLCFGHLMFEMVFGYELDSAEPAPRHLVNCQNIFTIQMLNFIFTNEKNTPTLKEVSNIPTLQHHHWKYRNISFD
ncbi:hypothetical protein ScPMuIL_007729 [Solemya velum]